MGSSRMESFMLPVGGFEYRGTNLDDLMSDRYTLATLVLDESGSTHSYAASMENTVKEIIKALRHSPVKDNLLYRQLHFGTNLREFHGFKQLHECNEADYDGCYVDGGRTSLYDSAVNAIESTVAEAQRLAGQQLMSNGIIVIMTDGCDYGSTLKMNNVKESLAKAVSNEELESLITLLLGVNLNEPARLEEFHKEVGFTRFDWIDNVDEKSLARIIGFISKSIVSQSKHLGSGGPSQQIGSLTF
jgi:hypothetical protein